VTPEPPPPRPPQIAVQRRSASDAPGLIFVAPKSFAGLQGPEIVDDRGRPVWFDALPPLQQAWGFRVQSYLGKPVLTWWQGGTHGDVGYGQGSTRSPTAPIG
jgi:hypothetical protein